MKTKAPKKKTIKKSPPTPTIETGDKCSNCGLITDSILYARGRYVCECCIDEIEEEDRDREW